MHELLGVEDLEQVTLYLEDVKGQNSEWCTDIKLNGDTFKIDTGAAVTAIRTKMYKYSRDGPLTTKKRKLYGPRNPLLTVAEQVNCQLDSKHGSVIQLVFVLDSLIRLLLGLPSIEALQFMDHMDLVEESEMTFKEKFPKVFSGLGRLEQDYTIHIR